jgi:hypothetical protein
VQCISVFIINLLYYTLTCHICCSQGSMGCIIQDDSQPHAINIRTSSTPKIRAKKHLLQGLQIASFSCDYITCGFLTHSSSQPYANYSPEVNA